MRHEWQDARSAFLETAFRSPVPGLHIGRRIRFVGGLVTGAVIGWQVLRLVLG